VIFRSVIPGRGRKPASPEPMNTDGGRSAQAAPHSPGPVFSDSGPGSAGRPGMTHSKCRGVLGVFARAHPEAAVERGREAYERGDYAAALKEWSQAAASEDPEASYRLGLLCARGHGVLANLADAAAWYRRAAEEGHAAAQHQLSLLHLDGYRAHASNFARWYGSAAKRDPEAADDNRTLLFPNGFDVPPDPAGALRWSRSAAEQGIADAQANTGLIYARGIGCEHDYREARHWYSLAAAQGSAAAELGLGILYANGHGWKGTFRPPPAGTRRRQSKAMRRRKWRSG
jgi:TPR repeat protein